MLANKTMKRKRQPMSDRLTAEPEKHKDLDGVAENQPTYRELIDIVDTREAEKAVPKPRVTSFVARDCSTCKALRDSDPATAGLNYSRMYAKVGNLRYCKCGYCGNTWKQQEA